MNIEDYIIIYYKQLIQHIKTLKDNAKNRKQIEDMQHKIKELEELK